MVTSSRTGRPERRQEGAGNATSQARSRTAGVRQRIIGPSLQERSGGVKQRSSRPGEGNHGGRQPDLPRADPAVRRAGPGGFDRTSPATPATRPPGFNDLFQNEFDYDVRELGSGFETVGSDIAADPQFLMTLPRPTETALASSNPAGGATGVRLGISPQLVFKWAVDSASASRATIKLRELTLGLGGKLQSVATSGDGLTIGGHDGAGG